jgi:hypothetical protein
MVSQLKRAAIKPMVAAAAPVRALVHDSHDLIEDSLPVLPIHNLPAAIRACVFNARFAGVWFFRRTSG